MRRLRPIFDALHRQEEVLHEDEATLQVLKPGRTSNSKSYMWLYPTGG